MKEIFASADYGLVGLLFFFTFFVVITFWTMRPKAKARYEDHGNIPLKENNDG
jgi:cbb3-type cytochrome oxidase subunit 3